MSNITYTVQPQRRERGWVEATPETAERWAVLKVQHFKARGRAGTSTRIAFTAPTRAEAQAAADSLRSATRKPTRLLPALGQRFPSTGVPIIARGIGRNHRKDY